MRVADAHAPYADVIAFYYASICRSNGTRLCIIFTTKCIGTLSSLSMALKIIHTGSFISQETYDYVL
jgi:hypothetical protein